MRATHDPKPRRRRRASDRIDADPWGFRRYPAIEPLAGLDGRPIPVSTFRRGGKLVSDPGIEPDDDCRSSVPRTSLAELYRRRAKILSEYRQSGQFSTDTLSLIEAVLYGKSPTAWAASREPPITRQAALERIHRLRVVAPFVWLAWRRTVGKKAR